MKKNLAILAILALASLPALAQRGPGGGAGNGNGPGAGTCTGMGTGAAQIDVTHATTVNGEVVRFAGGPGLGQPTLTVKVGGAETPYVLGSYRWLVAQSFAPKTGDLVRLLLYPCANCASPYVVAEVENLTQKTTLKLRNADGTPVFAGGGHGPGHGNGGACPNPDCPYRS